MNAVHESFVTSWLWNRFRIYSKSETFTKICINEDCTENLCKDLCGSDIWQVFVFYILKNEFKKNLS